MNILELTLCVLTIVFISTTFYFRKKSLRERKSAEEIHKFWREESLQSMGYVNMIKILHDLGSGRHTFEVLELSEAAKNTEERYITIRLENDRCSIPSHFIDRRHPQYDELLAEYHKYSFKDIDLEVIYEESEYGTCVKKYIKFYIKR